jgi:hypothetical protein
MNEEGDKTMTYVGVGLALIAVIAAPGLYMEDWMYSYFTGIGVILFAGFRFMWSALAEPNGRE